MCKHVPNVQTQVYAKCCKKWFDCANCHAENEDHDILKDDELIMICKPCKKVFKVRVVDFDPEADGFCPNCDNHWYIEADDPNKGKSMAIEMQLANGVDQVDAIRDDRDHNKEARRMKFLQERIYKGEDGVDIFNMLEDE